MDNWAYARELPSDPWGAGAGAEDIEIVTDSGSVDLHAFRYTPMAYAG